MAHGTGDDLWIGGSWQPSRAVPMSPLSVPAQPKAAVRKRKPLSVEGLFTTGAFPLAGSASQAWTDNRYEMVRHYRHWVSVAIDRIINAVTGVRPQVGIREPFTPPLEDPNEQPSVAPPPDSEFYGASHPPGWGHGGAERPGRGPRPRASRRIGWNASEHKAVPPVMAHECIEPVAPDHPLLRLLEDCNPYDTCADLWAETVLFYQLTGSAYWYLPRNLAGLPYQIWVIPSHWMWPIPGKDRMIEYYQVRPLLSQQVVKNIPADEILQFRRPHPNSKVDGSSPLTEAGTWVDGYESLDATRKHTLRNGIRPGLAIELDPEVQNPDEDIMARYDAKIRERFSGEHRAGLPFWVPPGAKIKPWTLSPRELDFGGTADQYRDMILAKYGVPKPVAGCSDDQTYGSVQSVVGTFYALTINPLLRHFARRLTEQVAVRYDPALVVWYPDATPDDRETSEQELQNDAKAGAITRNEYRARRGMAPLDGPEGEELLGVKVHAGNRPDTGAGDSRKPNYDGGENLEGSK